MNNNFTNDWNKSSFNRLSGQSQNALYSLLVLINCKVFKQLLIINKCVHLFL